MMSKRGTTIASSFDAQSKPGPKSQKGKCGYPTVSSNVISELVDGSSRIIDEMLKELHTLIESEGDFARREALVRLRINAMKERTNFRVLSRHVASAPRSVLDATENGFAEDSTGDFKKDFENLPEKLAAKFARDLPGWCLHVERPEILHLGHCRYDAADREFFCDAVVSLLQRPDTPDRVFVNVLFLDPNTNDVAKKNQRFSFPIQDILATIVPLLKSTEGKWNYQSRSQLSKAAAMDAAAGAAEEADAADDAASSDIYVKSEPIEELSNAGDEPLSLDSPPLPTHSAPPLPSKRGHVSESAIVDGKRRRKSRLSQETMREALLGFEDDIMDEDEVVETDSHIDHFLRKNENDEDFIPKERGPRTVHELEILGKCIRCNEFLNIGSAVDHMAEKHADDIVNRLQCPICGQTPHFKSLKDHLKRNHSNPEHRLDTMYTCPTCSKAFNRNYLLDEHVINVHKPDDKNFQCDQCPLKLASNRLLKNHVDAKHASPDLSDGQRPEMQKENEIKKRAHVCHICARSDFKKQERLEEHVATAHGSPQDYKHECPQCSKRFSTKRRLLAHLKIHTDDRNFECPTCKKCFKTKTNLRQHQQCHGPKKYKCEVCSQKFAYSSGLNNHRKALHGLDKPMNQLHSEEFMDDLVSEDSVRTSMGLLLDGEQA